VDLEVRRVECSLLAGSFGEAILLGEIVSFSTLVCFGAIICLDSTFFDPNFVDEVFLGEFGDCSLSRAFVMHVFRKFDLVLGEYFPVFKERDFVSFAFVVLTF